MADQWDKLKDERNRAYAAFMDYCAMGPGRSYRRLCAEYCRQSATSDGTQSPSGAPSRRPPTVRLRTIAGWCSQHDWPERAAAWDASLRTKEQDKWAEFLDELRKKEGELAELMMEKAERMIRWPLARSVSDTEEGVTIVEPADWRLADAARIAAEGSKLGRKAAGAEEGVLPDVEIVIRKIGGDVLESL